MNESSPPSQPTVSTPDRGPSFDLPMIDLGRMDYQRAFDVQTAVHAEVLSQRERPETPIGRLLIVEHDPPVITVSARAAAPSHLLASAEQLARAGVTVASTDRGGDITYHGPGQLVAYPILDLNRLRLPLHGYIRLLEHAIVATVNELIGDRGLRTDVRPGATGVWAWRPNDDRPRKIAAIGVRVRRWVTLHGLALNVTTDLSHFDLIVPCGLTGELAGGGVTSVQCELQATPPPPSASNNAGESGTAVPSLTHTASVLHTHLRRLLGEHVSASDAGAAQPDAGT